MNIVANLVKTIVTIYRLKTNVSKMRYSLLFNPIDKAYNLKISDDCISTQYVVALMK